jgi:type II secretory pathway pseudopilin PulG
LNAQGYSRKAVKRIEVILVVAVLGVAAFLAVPAVNRSRTAAARQACLANLGQIGQAFGGYLKDSDQHWPWVDKLASIKLHDPPWPTLPTVLSPYLKDNLQVFRCPADRRVLAEDSPLRAKFPAKTTWFETEGTSYEVWLGEAYAGRKIGEELLAKAGVHGLGRADEPLLTDFDAFHQGDGGGAFNTLNADLKPRTTRAKGD